MHTGRQRSVTAIENALSKGLASLKMVPVVAWEQLSGYKRAPLPALYKLESGFRQLGCTWPARAPDVDPLIGLPLGAQISMLEKLRAGTQILQGECR